jgi:hypothetical protein
MTSKQRILAVLNGRKPDHVPLTTWCFGFPAPKHLKWSTNGRSVEYWYTVRLEHLHSLPIPWTLEDDFKRAEAWLSIGVDDAMEVSVPWSMDPAVTYREHRIEPGKPGGDERYPVAVREYETPAGPVRHAVRKTGGEGGGWPIEPEGLPLIEDYNIPRAVEHVVRSPKNVPAVRHLYAAPDASQKRWLADRMDKVRAFAQAKGLFVQAWTAFGMDAAVWLTGTENAILLAMDEPKAFRELMEIIFQTDYARTQLAAETDGIDMICQRGWYSSTDFWSPKMFDELVFPYTKQLADLAHRHGKKFGYVMTTGVEKLGSRLADAGVDLLFFVDPVQDRMPLETARDKLSGRMTLVGGTNALSLQADPQRICDEVRLAMDILGPTNRFILHPMDAIFPDTPWSGVETMIEAWKEYQ